MDEERAKALGDRIRGLREAKGISQSEFAAQSGFNPNVLSRIERGANNITLITLFKVAGALKVDASDLIRGL